MRTFKIYLIDFDGTLINSYDGLYHFYNDVFNPFGETISKEEAYYFSKISLEAAFDIKIKDRNKYEDFKKKCYEVIDTKVLLKYNKPFPDALKLIDFLARNNYPSAIVTGNALKQVQYVFNALELPKFYNTIISGDNIEKQKPDPQGINRALEALNYQGELKDVAYIGDSYNDFLAAKNAGVTPILVDRFNEFPPSDKYIRITSLEKLINN